MPPDSANGPLVRELDVSSLLAPADFSRAQRVAAESGEPLDLVLTRLGLLSERQLVEAIAASLGLPIATASEFPSEPVLPNQISPKFLKSKRLIPLADEPDALVVAMANPTDADAVTALAFALDKPVRRKVTGATDIETAWERLYGTQHTAASDSDQTGQGGDDVDRLRDLASEAPVIRLVNNLISTAVELRASDLHLEPFPGQLRLRYRIDGILREYEAPPERLKLAIVSRIKVMAKLNIAERRLAQDGRIRLAVRGREIDLRVATTPTLHGEALVLRVLDGSAQPLDFKQLGFSDRLLPSWRRVLEEPHGIVLVTGPTGSGKTTTLYAALDSLNGPDRKILTIEDPIEIQLSGVNQVQVKPQIGLTFANALRSFLRHDPDVMMVGEIRDLETAQTAVQAALTGHLILSTLHTNDAASAVTRLLDMGVEDYLLTATINGILGQRLVRVLCPHCREAVQPLPDIVARFNLPADAMLYRPRGCEACGGEGFNGRSTITELLVMTDTIRQLVLQRADTRAVQALAVEEGMVTMFDDGLTKALAGITTLEDVLRATREG